MLKKLMAYLQYVLPQHGLSVLAGYLAESRHPWLKNFLIKHFVRHYHVDMSNAVTEDINQYPTFNLFFIRQLKPETRPIALSQQAIASPVDGTISQINSINKNQLFQAKQFYFNLNTLLGNDTELAQQFHDGHYATLYLAPQNYHRIHIPLAGTLEKTIYVPGNLFSVNRMTSELIFNLYSRNERLINVFHTQAGYMAVILVGALMVGQIQTVWMERPVRDRQLKTTSYNHTVKLEKGDELGHFKMGSTVILLFQKNRIQWLPHLSPCSPILFGQWIGNKI